jgi:hypothetical protein
MWLLLHGPCGRWIDYDWLIRRADGINLLLRTPVYAPLSDMHPCPPFLSTIASPNTRLSIKKD